MRTTAGIAAGIMLGAVALAGCGTSKPAAHSATPAANSPSVAVSSSVPTHPLSYYAAQYTRIGKTCIADQDTLNKQLAAKAADAILIASGAKAATDCRAADNNLLRANWPSNVLVDIKAEVNADAPANADLADLADRAGEVDKDATVANAAANIVYADLGLPPLN